LGPKKIQCIAKGLKKYCSAIEPRPRYSKKFEVFPVSL